MQYIAAFVAGILIILFLLFDCGGSGTGSGSGTGEEKRKEKVVETSEEVKPSPEEKTLEIIIADEDFLVNKKKVDLLSLIQTINEGVKREGFNVTVICQRARANQYNAIIKALKDVQAVYKTDGCD